ncbi:L-ascorbate metabolism protein UlaG, beta-lactamase superfamily [Pseudorhodobacter antarcticus]|uniref:L-ascorbate metabolism protein UlaG, beta-lactamase superfamily n=2 Tax=Pseudorhodobacter antarcticus TaxID=1077947 RepID=A0A1H8A880_9RHOB|nr:MBL fold metallo-hydrolase [Pseudorhodobacter antarcticus]SEM66686.1 L-ascorbate metabolism protein UlaG, beta-lactamase superfamily [Pseudorhodobacter antarcticus]
MMKRRQIIKGTAALGALGACGGGAAVAVTNSKNRYYSGPVSDHFDGVQFFNPDGAAPAGFGDLLKWQLGGGKAEWPDLVPVPQKAKPASSVQDVTITMVGHATMLIQTAGMNILTDPVWSDRASPLAFAGPKRVTEPGIALVDLPRIDAVLLSHNHYDHLDIATMKALHAAHQPMVVTPLGNDTILQNAIPGIRTTAGDWGDTATLGLLSVHFEPCHHWSARGIGDRSCALWTAFVIAGPNGKILHIGDTGFDQGRPYRDLPAKHGAIRAAILPIGAYEPRWFMRDQHQNPDEAVQGFKLSGTAHAIGHHWGTFQLTDEARDAPLIALDAALQKHKVSSDRFRALAPGQSWAIPPL